MPTLVVSACLLGRPCRYDGGSKAADRVVERCAGWAGPVVAVCPEELGGLGTPRPAAWLSGGGGDAVLAGGARVVRTHDGADVTAAFVVGAERAAARAGAGPGDVAVLKARSPSCGCGATWIDGEVRPDDGVFAALLRRRGVRVGTDEDPLP